MQSLERDYFNPFFSHIYVEKGAADHPRTKEILAKFPSSRIISISHYKDVFCRSGQSIRLQQRTQNLILALREGNLIYPGAPVCQNFGNENFYYTSCMMNCIYDCAYCYLKGMYPSANLVIFVNLETVFEKVAQMLQKAPLYLCVSYDTDLLALEAVAGYAGAWSRFAGEHEAELTIEVRTKCANKQYFRTTVPQRNVIYAFTLSPQVVTEAYERHTPSLAERIACAADAVEMGFQVRLCFDPMLYVHGWQRWYAEMLEEVFWGIPMEKLTDVSVGSFRIPQGYLKNMRKRDPDRAVLWFPYDNENGICHYPEALRRQMEHYLIEKLTERLPKEKIAVI